MVTNQLQVARKYSGDQESITIVSTNGFTRWGLNWCTQVSAICSPLAPALHNATGVLHSAAIALCNAMAILVSRSNHPYQRSNHPYQHGDCARCFCTASSSAVTLIVTGRATNRHFTIWIVSSELLHQHWIVTLHNGSSYYVMNRHKDKIVPNRPLVV